MREIDPARQIAGEPPRRWFAGKSFDLIVWYAQGDEVGGFQLCYRKGVDEHALTWWRGKGYSHSRIDDGEGLPDHHKMSPILVPDGTFDKKALAARFREEGRSIDPELVNFVAETIGEYPGTSA